VGGRDGREAERLILAESGMTAFETETVESCRSIGMDPAELSWESRARSPNEAPFEAVATSGACWA
jgi:hypothetical protein